jgi:hypothetical protein
MYRRIQSDIFVDLDKIMQFDDDLLEKAKSVLRKGGEIFWFDGSVKHISSLKNPHPIMPLGCNGQCCNQPIPNKESVMETIRHRN